MSNLVPSENEEPVSRYQALYLGTSLFEKDAEKMNMARLHLAQLQASIGERYPVNGSSYCQGIQTCLSVYPSGLQMEHSSTRGSTAISALFFYPIKSLVYCGALRFCAGKAKHEWSFVPLDTELAKSEENLRNPPLFVAFVRG